MPLKILIKFKSITCKSKDVKDIKEHLGVS